MMNSRAMVDFKEAVVMYRHIQILPNIGNEIQQKVLVFPVIFDGKLVLAFSLAMMVRIPFT